MHLFMSKWQSSETVGNVVFEDYKSLLSQIVLGTRFSYCLGEEFRLRKCRIMERCKYLIKYSKQVPEKNKQMHLKGNQQ